MTTLTIPISEEHLEQLQALAVQYQVTPEELVQASIHGLLSHPDEWFQQILEYVLRKNAELYRRLA
jgi:antitoxin FitA